MNLKNILGFSVGPLASAALGLLTVPVVAWAFSPEDVGRFSILQVVLSFSLLLSVLGLDQAYVREFHESCDRPRLLKACFTPGLTILLLGMLATIAFGRLISIWLFNESSGWIYPLTLVCVAATYVSRFLSLILRMQERGLAFSMSQVIPKVLQLVLLAIVMLTDIERNFFTLLMISVLCILTVTSIYTWNTQAQWRPALISMFDIAQTRELLKFGLPLVLSGLAYWALTATSIIMLRTQSSLPELAVYSITSSIAGAAAIFQSIFTVVWAPTVYKWLSQGVDMTRVDTVARQALAVVCFVFLITGIFSWLIDYFLPEHYGSVKYLVLCAIAPPLLYTLSEITCVGIAITRRTALTIWITLSALTTNVAVSYWLIPIYGSAGAVMANAVAYVVFFVARTETSARVWRPFPRTRLYHSIFVIIFCSILTVVFGASLPFNISLLWLAGLPLMIFYFQIELREVLDFLKISALKEIR